MWFPARVLRNSKSGRRYNNFIVCGNVSNQTDVPLFSSSFREYDVQYLDDGKTECGVPEDELRFTSELDRDMRNMPPKSLSLPLEGLLDISNLRTDAPVKTPRAVVHNSLDSSCSLQSGRSGNEAKELDETSGVFVLEGQQEHLATGGGVRGIRFLKNSTRA